MAAAAVVLGGSTLVSAQAPPPALRITTDATVALTNQLKPSQTPAVAKSATPATRTEGPPQLEVAADLIEWQHQFLDRTMEDLTVLGLPVYAVEYRSERSSFFFSYSGGRLVVRAQHSDANSARIRDYILDWVRHFNRRGMIIRQIRYPEKLLTCEKGVLSIPALRPPPQVRQ